MTKKKTKAKSSTLNTVLKEMGLTRATYDRIKKKATKKAPLKEYLIIAVYTESEWGCEQQRFADCYSARTPEEAEAKCHKAAEAALSIAAVFEVHAQKDETYQMTMVG